MGRVSGVDGRYVHSLARFSPPPPRHRSKTSSPETAADGLIEVIGENEAAEKVVRASALKRWCELGVAGGAKFGRDFRAPLKYRKWMVEAGFVDVKEKQVLVPVNTWPVDPVDSHMGGWFSLDVQKGVKGTTKLLEAAGMSTNEIPGFMDEVCHNVTHRAMRAYSPRKWSGP